MTCCWFKASLSKLNNGVTLSLGSRSSEKKAAHNPKGSGRAKAALKQGSATSNSWAAQDNKLVTKEFSV